jgi:hypothetical protein
MNEKINAAARARAQVAQWDGMAMALALGVQLPERQDPYKESYRWHADWVISADARSATHITGARYSFKPWVKGMSDGTLPDSTSWPARKWLATLDADPKPTAITKAAIRRCLEASRLFDHVAAFRCLDCNVDTDASGDYYMVQRKLWLRARPEDHGMLCLDCLEKRIRRPLVRGDFTLCVVNDMSAKVQARSKHE